MKRLIRYLVPALVSLVGQAPISAYSLDLQAVYQLARQNDASFAANQQVYEAAKLNQPLAKAAMKPVVAATGGIERTHSQFTPDGAVGSGYTSNTAQIGLSLQQKIYDVREQLTISQADVGIEIARLNLVQQEQALILKVAQRYFDVLAALDRKSLAEKEQAAIGRQLDLAEQRLEVGLGTKTDLHDANARYLLAESSLIGAENSIEDARQSLEEIIGQRLSDELAKLAEDDTHIEIRPADQWLQTARENSVAINIAKQNYESARLDVEKASKLRNPVVSVSGAAGFADTGATSSVSAGENESWSAGVSVNVPLYQGGSVKFQQIQAGHKLTETELKLSQAEREMETAVLSAYRGVDSSQRQVRALAEAVIASESALEAKEEGFKAGVTTNLDVLDGQRDLFSARSNYLSARYNAILALLRLEQAAGGLEEDDIQEINKRLAPG